MTPSTSPTAADLVVRPDDDQRRDRGGVSKMLDSVQVDPSMFESLVLSRAMPKRKFQANRQPGDPVIQELTNQGVPKWIMTVIAETEYDTVVLKISIARRINPMEDIGRNVEVVLPGLRYGVNPLSGGGYSLWMNAQDIVPAAAQQKAA